MSTSSTNLKIITTLFLILKIRLVACYNPLTSAWLKKIHTQALSPKNVDIRIHMYKATVKKMLSKVDQENFQKEMKGRKQGNPEGPFSLDLAPYPLQKL